MGRAKGFCIARLKANEIFPWLRAVLCYTNAIYKDLYIDCPHPLDFSPQTKRANELARGGRSAGASEASESLFFFSLPPPIPLLLPFCAGVQFLAVLTRAHQHQLRDPGAVSGSRGKSIGRFSFHPYQSENL